MSHSPTNAQIRRALSKALQAKTQEIQERNQARLIFAQTEAEGLSQDPERAWQDWWDLIDSL